MFTRAKINTREARRILRSPDVAAELERAGEKIRDAAGSDDHEVQTFTGNRARVTVRTSTPRGRALEATERRLSSSLDAGRS
jgi:hypothetical protein